MAQSRSILVVGVAVSVGIVAWVAGAPKAVGQPFPSAGSPNPAMTGRPAAPAAAEGSAGKAVPAEPKVPTPPKAEVAKVQPEKTEAKGQPEKADAAKADATKAEPPATGRGTTAPAAVAGADAVPGGQGVPRARPIARTTTIPRCTSFVQVGAGRGTGTAEAPFGTIAAAIAAAPSGAVICVGEGTYQEELRTSEKAFTLAGGFQRGSKFTVRDSARHVTKALGKRGTGVFFRVDDPGPSGGQLIAIDGFEIGNYAQAIVRDLVPGQRFDVTNNYIHDNACDEKSAGGGLALNNVTGRIQGNVFRNNGCGRGGALFLQDSEQKNTVVIAENWVEGNHGIEKDTSHGGAFYLFGKTITVTGNMFVDNTVTQWGGGLYVGAWVDGKQYTTAKLSWNVYRGNRAGNAGGGFFCDDGATCVSENELFVGNCGGNIYLDSGSDAGPTVARFTHLTSVGALDADCKEPGPGLRIDKAGKARDAYSVTNAIFWNNAPGQDIVANCDGNCRALKVTVTHTMTQPIANPSGAEIVSGPGIVKPVDPLFAAPDKADFHLKSAAGRWTPSGFVTDAETSPAIGKGVASGGAAAVRVELGTYGGSAEASRER